MAGPVGGSGDVYQQVEWRCDGHQLTEDDAIGVLRFEVADINALIKNAAAASPLYDGIVADVGLPVGTEVLPLSCFALADGWSAARLAEGTRFRAYRCVRARVLLSAGYELWPTAISDDNGPDPRNEVHYDLVVLRGSDLRLDELAVDQPRHVRAAARDRLRPAFERALALMGEPVDLPDQSPGGASRVQDEPEEGGGPR